MSSPTFDFSTAMLSDRRKREALCDIIGREVLKVDLSVPRDVTPHAAIRFKALPRLGLSGGSLSKMRFDHAADRSDNDDIVFLMSAKGHAALHQRGTEIEIGTGAGVAMANGESAFFRNADGFEIRTLRLERDRLASRVRHLDDKAARYLPPTVIASLIDRAATILRGDDDDNAALTTDLYHLAAIAFGADPRRDLTLRISVRANHLRRLKSDLLRRLTEGELSVADLARRHRLSERYIQRLFLEDGTSLSEFLATRRIERAEQMLLDPRLVATNVSEIAYSVGFGDLSYFNRRFRKRFGRTPGDVRARR